MTGNRKKYKIAILSSSFPPVSYGGICASNYNLYNMLKRTYFAKVYTYFDSTNHHNEDDDNIHRFMLPFIITKSIQYIILAFFRFTGIKGEVYQFSNALCSALAGLKVYYELRKFAPDIVIVPDHGPVSAFWPALPNAKIIYVSHHNTMRFHKEPLLGEHSEKDALMGRYLEQCAISKADAVVCPSHYMKKVFQETYKFNGSVEVIANMVDDIVMRGVHATPLHEILGLSQYAPIVYIPSAGSVYKGSQFVMELIRRISQGYSHEIGFYLSGAFDRQFEAHLGYLPDNVKLHCPGPVPYLENIANIKACALCLSPTLIENFGMALLEAQWNSIPVITFDVGGNRDIVSNEVTGYLIDFGDLDSMVSKTVEFLTSPAEVSAMGLSAGQYTRQHFDSKIILEKYRSLFELI